MKNQRFGDVNDFWKYGLLRALASASGLRLGIVWFLTEDDGCVEEGSFDYLDQPERYRAFDPGLFDKLSRAKAGVKRRVILGRRWRLLPPDTVFSAETLTDIGACMRRSWWWGFWNDTKNCPLVFLDPDAGLDFDGAPEYGARGSARYAYWDEISDQPFQGRSIIVSEPVPPERREARIEDLRAEISYREWPVEARFLGTPGALFMVAALPEHAPRLMAGLDAFEATWLGSERPH